MKYLKFISFVAVIVAIIQGCKKENVVSTGTASLTVINAVPGSNPLVTNFSGNYALSNYYKNALQISYGTYNTTYEFGAYSGITPLALYAYPDTLATSKPLYNLSLNLLVNTIHTLFLTGTTTSPDTLLTADQPPYHSSSDSTMGLRFVNLSPGSNPVSVNLSGSANGSEVASLSYKGVTAFKNYATVKAVSSYTFQVKDAGTGNLIASFTFSGINNAIGTNTSANLYRFRNFTLALKGVPGGTGALAQGLFLINNY